MVKYIVIGTFVLDIFARAAGFHISFIMSFLITAVGVGMFWGLDQLLSAIFHKNNKKM